MKSNADGSMDDRLSRAMRLVASQASTLCGGAAVLTYTHGPGDPSVGRLRAAAGFRSADEARDSARELSGLVAVTLDQRQAQIAPAPRALSDRLTGANAHAIPLSTRQLCVGALVIVTLVIMATRHFRALHAASSDPGGAAQGIGRLRPPVHFKNRTRVSCQMLI